MSQLGKFVKQPKEVERYSIQYVNALSSTDELTSIGVVAAATKNPQRINAVNDYMVAEDADNLLVVAQAKVMLPNVAEQGAKVFIANANATAPITIQALGVPIQYESIDEFGGASAYVIVQTTNYSLLANETAEFVYSDGAWRESFYVRANVVTKPGDQRVRFLVGGGEPQATYYIENTVSTADGRVLQDEFQVKIKEI